MECFTDGQGRFVFPNRLFPELADSAAAPPSVAARKAAIEREFALLKGAGVERNYRWAVEVFQFQDTWGDLSQAERGHEILDQARRIVDKLASGSTPFSGAANYMLGLLAPSDNASRVHYRTALKKGFDRAWFRVAAKADARGDKETALSRFKRGAEKGDAACLYTLGLAYIKGHLKLPQNVNEGLHLIEEAVHKSDADFPRPPYVLGKILLGEGGNVPNGLGLKVGQLPLNRERGLQLVQQSAFLGFGPALLRMGQARQTKEFGFDCAIALRYMSLAAEQEAYRRFRHRQSQLRGDPEANIVKWLLCGYKDVIRVNEQWAFRFAEIGAAERNGTALFALGYFYEVGVNTDTDAAKAIEYYRDGAREGCAAASARLDQMATNKPNLRRTLTRKDHDAKLKKHRTALINGEGDAGLAAINDQSTLDSEPPVNPREIPSPIPEAPLPQARPLAQPKIPYPDSPGGSPQQSMSDLTAPQRGPSLSSLSSGPSMHSVASTQSPLPYPVDDQQQDQSRQRVHQAASFHSVSSRPSLPYPDAYDPNTPLQFGGPLPYPRSPESPRRVPPSDERLTGAVQSTSLEDNTQRAPRTMPSYRSFSSGPGMPNKAVSESPPRSTNDTGFRRGHGATMSMGNIPSASRPSFPQGMSSSESLQTVPENAQPNVPSSTIRQSSPEYSSRVTSSKGVNRVPVGGYPKPGTNEAAGMTTNASSTTAQMGVPEPPMGRGSSNAPTFTASPVRVPPYPRGSPPTEGNTVFRAGSHTVADSAPVSARNSLHSASGELPRLTPSVPAMGSSYSQEGLRAASQHNSRAGSSRVSPSNSTHSLADSPNFYSTPSGSPNTSRPTSLSPSSSIGSKRSPPGSPGSKGSPGSPGRRRKARPLSSSWVRESFLPGASRFFSASQPSQLNITEKEGYADDPEPAVRQRSPSPLRKMFKSTSPDHRSVTDSAMLHKPRGPDPSVANIPKVPVQPIKEQREPGVAYTFEDMGVTAVTSAKNDKCIIA